MPSDETLQRVKRVLRTCLKVDVQTAFPDTMPLIGGDYDLDSLDILLIVTELEREFGVKINDGAVGKAAFTNISTLAELMDRLASSNS